MRNSFRSEKLLKIPMTLSVALSVTSFSSERAKLEKTTSHSEQQAETVFDQEEILPKDCK